MRVMRIAGVLALVALVAGLLPSTGRAAPALQGQNLLANPGFEQPYEDIRRGRRASGWRQWYEDTGHEDVLTFRLEVELNPLLIQEGSASQHIGNKTFAWHGGMAQVAAVPAGTPVRFCAYGRVFVSNDDFEKVSGYSWEGFKPQMRVGIFPNGDVEWTTPGIIWSGETNPNLGFQQMCVDATVGDTGKVTVFTSNDFRASAGDKGVLAYHVDAWWDNASLVATGPAGTPAPTTVGNVPTGAKPPAQPVATAAPIACEIRADGSVVRVVQSGDTVLGIAIACDSTVAAIRQLNNLQSDLINVGQTLVVKGPTAPPTAVPAPTQAVPPTPVPTATPTGAEICVEAFNDANANRSKDDGEQLLGGVGFTLSDASGPKGSYVTSGLEPEPYCFAGLTPGPYTIEARPPNGVTSTTDAQWQVGLTGGVQQMIQYGGSRGAAPAGTESSSSAAPSAAGGATTSSSADGSSSLGRIAVGVLGVAILLVAGFMAGLVVMRSRR